MLLTEIIKDVSNQALSSEVLDEFIEWVLDKANMIVDNDVSALAIEYLDKVRMYIRLNKPSTKEYLENLQLKIKKVFEDEGKYFLSGNSLEITIYGEENISSDSSGIKGLESFYPAIFKLKDSALGIFAISSGGKGPFLAYKINIFNTFVKQAALGIDSVKAKELVIKQAEIINSSKAKMEAAFASIHDGLIMVDASRQVIFSNPMASKMLDVTEGLVSKEIILSFFLPLLEYLGKSNNKTASREIETGTSPKRIIQAEASPIMDVSGDRIGIIILLRDITRLREIDNMKAEFISTVSHELRTPLATIKEAISQVLEGLLGETTKEQKEFLSICLEDIERLTRIINGLLDISKIEANKLRVKKEIVDIVVLVKGVAASFTPRVKGKEIEIRTESSDETIEVYCDRDKMIQVFTNLVGNAFKFTSSGYIEISVTDKEGWVECAVTDTGKGIAKDDLDKVFDKFMQFGREYGPGEKGTGLGLSITKGIIELHKGKIWVESEPGRGTRFIFTIPKYKPIEGLLYDSIKNILKEEKDSFKEYLVFILRIDNYKKIEESLGQAKAEDIFGKIFYILQEAKGEDFVIAKDISQMAVISEGRKQDIYRFSSQVKKVVKDVIFDMAENTDVKFSYGCFMLPANTDNIEEVLDGFSALLVSEKEERLNKKILIVDDDKEIVSFLNKALCDFGYVNLREAYNGKDALNILQKETIDLIILDMKMPKMNGYELIGRMKGELKTKDIPVVIMSGYKVEYDKLEDYVKKTPIPVIGKPISIDELKRIVNYIL